MVTVPACEACQKRKSLGDRDLRNFILMDVGGSEHPDAEEMTKKMLKSVNVRLRLWIQKQLTTAETIDLVTDDGIVVGSVLANDFNTDPMLLSQEMTVRGLYFHEKGMMLPPLCPFYVQHVPWHAAPKVIADMTAMAPTLFKSRGNNVAAWGFHQIDDGDSLSTSWLVFYNNWILFWIVTGSSAVHARERREAFQTSQSRIVVRGPTGRRQIPVPRDPHGGPIIPPQ